MLKLLTKQYIEYEEFRVISLLYGVMGTRDWREIAVDDIQFDKRELQNQLLPVMRKSTVGREGNWVLWTNTLLQGCKNALRQLLPFHASEKNFLNQLYNHGNLEATLLTSDQKMIQKIHSHPLLQWKIQLIVSWLVCVNSKPYDVKWVLSKHRRKDNVHYSIRGALGAGLKVYGYR